MRPSPYDERLALGRPRSDKEALETLVADSGVGGWLDQSIQLSANVHRRLLLQKLRRRPPW